MDTQELLRGLAATVRAQRDRAAELARLPQAQLLRRPSSYAWNALETLEHLNLSSGIYVRGLERVFSTQAKRHAPNASFRPGWLGNWFTNGLKPGPKGAIRWRMRTFKRFEPSQNGGASMENIERFINLCNRTLALIEQARSTDLGAMRVTSSLGPLVRFKAGDALRFPIAHQERHFLQLEQALRS